MEQSLRYEDIWTFFNKLDRSFFIDNENKAYAHYDEALAIAYGQTISQPSLVLQMTVELDLNKDCKVLELGTGSGYQTAFLAEFAGTVYTVEKIADLSYRAQQKLTDLDYENIIFKIGDGSKGWIDHAPYDRIIVTAGASKIPEELIEQLGIGGKLIIPVGEQESQQLVLLEKDTESQIHKRSLGDVRFVEFKGEYGWH